MGMPFFVVVDLAACGNILLSFSVVHYLMSASLFVETNFSPFFP
jgi:hypothetical protein